MGRGIPKEFHSIFKTGFNTQRANKFLIEIYVKDGSHPQIKRLYYVS